MNRLFRIGFRAAAALFLIAWLAGRPATPQDRKDDAETPRADAGVDSSEKDSKQAPREIGFFERAERDLAQIDVTVRGPWESISDLDESDFDLIIGGTPIEKLVVDSLCRPPGQTETASLQATNHCVPRSASRREHAC